MECSIESNFDSLITRGTFLIVVFCWLVGCQERNGFLEEAPQILPNSLQGTLTFSKIIGGAEFESIRDVIIDNESNIFVTGYLQSPDLYGNFNDLGSSEKGKSDVFLAKIKVDGEIIWGSILGGPGTDGAYAIELDEQGFIYIGGRAGEGFPTTNGVFQEEFKGGEDKAYGPQDGFIAKITPDGKSVVWTSFFGAWDTSRHIVRDLAVNSKGEVYLAASTGTGRYSNEILNGFKMGFQAMPLGGQDCVIAKISANGSNVLWATYVGGKGTDWGEPSIRLGPDESIYFLTVTDSPDMPVTQGAYDSSYNGGIDFYLMKLSPLGDIIFGTYLGGNSLEHVETHHLEIDEQGNAVIAASTNSKDFPVTLNAFDNSHNGNGGQGTGANSNYQGDISISKISSDGTRLIASTLIGGRWGESAEGIALDARGRVYLTGATYSKNFPITTGSLSSMTNEMPQTFFVVFSPELDRVLYSTYVSLDDHAYGRSASVSPDGKNFVLAGHRDRNKNSDGFLVKFSLTDIANGH